MQRAPVLVPALALVLAAVVALPAAAITGDYLEARTSDVYTGPCFANSEVNLAGKEAILAWRVSEGAWDGVDLSDLAVVAVVRADATLGDPYGDPEAPARSVVVVDERASREQRQALVSFARSMASSGGRDLLGAVAAVEAAPIELAVADRNGAARLKAGEVAELATRGLTHEDHLCGNETVYYDPLAATTRATPAVTLEHRYSGDALGKTWSSPNKRSAFVGSFER
jgi:hypothetical protein